MLDNTPILVGCGDVTDMTTPGELGRSPYEITAQTAMLALKDAAAPGLKEQIDSVAMLRFFADTSHRFDTKLGRSSNPPRSVTKRMGIAPAEHIYTWNGGNMPQYMVNEYAERIQRGELRAAMVMGGEALRTQHTVERQNLPISWAEDPGGVPVLVGDSRRGWNDIEDRHNMRAAISIYPLFENAVRGFRGRDVRTHLDSIGKLMSQFSAVAAANPLATRRDGFTAEQLSTVTEENRWIGFPYPRYMNSNAFIDQSAAVVMTSVGVAKQLGIPRSKWVFLHGCADGHDHWYATDRINLHSSPAIRSASRLALNMANKTLNDFEFLDLYSCFASAVQIGCLEIGLEEDDPRKLTVTGGLPYFGGPGNNYVTHSISEMIRRVRSKPGSYGLVTANGNYVTKHSFGVYSTEAVEGTWQRESPAVLQRELNMLPKAPFTDNPNGNARIETYTVMHGRKGPEYGLVLGRLDSTGERFVANTPPDEPNLLRLRDEESLGRSGTVKTENGLSIFSFS